MNLSKAIDDNAEREKEEIEAQIEIKTKELRELMSRLIILKAHITINGISHQLQDGSVEKSG